MKISQKAAVQYAIILMKVTEILKGCPQGMTAAELAKKVGLDVRGLYIWWANFGQHIPGLEKPRVGMFLWNQSAADAVKE